MQKIMPQAFIKFYNKTILLHAKLCIIFILCITAALSFYISKVHLEVSADSLVLENDKDLEFYRFANARYGSDDYLVITYKPFENLFSEDELSRLESLSTEIQQLKLVDNVISILNVPLLFSPPLSLTKLANNPPNLRDAETQQNLAITELSSSPLYGNRLLSTDQKTTAIQVNYKQDKKLARLLTERSKLRGLSNLSSSEQQALTLIESSYREHQSIVDQSQQSTIAHIRKILEPFNTYAEIHMGGLPMIVVDMLQFIRHDISVFGSLVLLIMALLMRLAFKGMQWVLLPVFCVAVSTISTLGIVGILGWPISAVSSNFIALLLIFGLSLIIHLIVHYKELAGYHPGFSQHELVKRMIEEKFTPSFFTILTTIIAFGSLVVSNIRPVIDFGWIMVIALVVNLIVAFTLFPALLSLMKRVQVEPINDMTGKITHAFAFISVNHRNKVLLVTLSACLLGIFGILKLSVDNRFIDYFAADTEIYQGMVTIDEQLGGTTPLDILIDAPLHTEAPSTALSLEEEGIALDPFSDDPFSENALDKDPFSEDSGPITPPFTEQSFWFNSERLDTIKQIHHYLDDLPDTGKVLSLNTTVESLEKLNNQTIIDNFFLSIFYKNLSDTLKSQLISPYLSKAGDQTRFTTRVYESNKGLDRQGLIDQIKDALHTRFNISPDQIHITGMVVLYNNLLQSLFQSQILTLGAVFIAIALTFVVIFRSIKVAIIALIPNLVSALCVLGLLGGFNIALDLMTITIAAISVGIAVDDTIHYVHRFEKEWQKEHNYQTAIFSAHKSIGKAMYYTSITISLGFAVMIFSKFTPTIYFGVFTALAMLIALIANLTILPILLARFKAYGFETPQPPINS